MTNSSVLSCFLLLIIITGCRSLKNGQNWGEEAVTPMSFERIQNAAINALLDPQTLIPATSAAIFAINNFDKKTSQWAVKNTPIYGSEDNAEDMSDYLLYVLYAETPVTFMLTSSGEDTGDWLLNKGKGILTEGVAWGSTVGLTGLLKSATDRNRPNGSGLSFPSGHASSAYSLATLSSRNLNSISMPQEIRTSLKIANIVTAGAVGWARVEAKKHYPADVLAGFAIGHFVSAFIHDAFMGVDEETEFRFYVAPNTREAYAEFSFDF